VERTAKDLFVDTAAAWFSSNRRLPLLWREQANRALLWRRPDEGATLIGEGIKNGRIMMGAVKTGVTSGANKLNRNVSSPDAPQAPAPTPRQSP
jgi:hypothetical protein